ncbi:MAG TPA: dienelactone hydrolase family protein [Alphaproteobacteria bacterium]|nr:dienelactone hydrolase family protein [Alphaproteobacteria bacterium]
MTQRIDQRIIELFDAFTHSAMDRREFMTRLSGLAGGLAAASALIALLEGSDAQAAITSSSDPRLEAGKVTYPGRSGPMKAYLARPETEGKRPAVVVIHENRGLNPHIEDVARRFALDGFLALAPDALSPLGGTPADSDEARQRIYTLDRSATIGDFLAAVSYLKTHPGSNGKVGCVGFCWGGAMSNQLAVHSRDLGAAVVFYGRSPTSGDVPKIKAPLLLHYGGLDTRINAGVPAYETALKAVGATYTVHMYEGANHAFHNDTRPARYDNKAADLAWERTVAFFKKHLS